MNLAETFEKKAKTKPRKVVFPESKEEKILRAVQEVTKRMVAYPILLGNEDELTSIAQKLDISLKGVLIVDNKQPEIIESFVQRFTKINPSMPAVVTRRILQNPLYFAAMMVRMHEADSMVAGLANTTGDVILASQNFIGMQDGIETPSSMAIFQFHGFRGSEGEFLVLADPTTFPDPDSSQLADIAIATAQTTRDLLGWEPRVAMLSFSTKGSAQHLMVDKVVKAVNIVKQRRPDLLIDGELQVDSALIPEVAAKKIKDAGPVAGRANILIFPDLNVGNISVKLLQCMADTSNFGAVLQGFAMPVSDLSRGAGVKDIVLATIISVIRCSDEEKTLS